MKRILILAVAWLALSAVAAAAQTTATATLGISIPTMLKIVNNTGDWTMPAAAAITDAQIESGATISSTNTIDIETKGNVGYKVTVTAGNFSFTPTFAPDAGYVKNANTASVTVGGTTAVLNGGTSLITHPRGATYHDNATANLTLSLNDPPGDYSTVVTFTIAAN